MQMFDRIRNIRYVLVLFAMLIAIGSLLMSNYLISDLEEEERNRMEVWAEAMRSLNAADENTDMNLVLKVINGNHTIPVIIVDKDGKALSSRNIGNSWRTRILWLICLHWQENIGRAGVLFVLICPRNTIRMILSRSVMTSR